MSPKEELTRLKENLLKAVARGKKQVYLLEELKKHVDLAELSRAFGSSEEEILKDLLTGKVLSFRFPKADNKTYIKFLNMYKMEQKARKEGKKLIYLGFPFLEGPGVRGPVLLYPAEIEVNQRKGEVKIKVSPEPMVNELLFVFLEKKAKRGLDEEGTKKLLNVEGDPKEVLSNVAKVLKEYLPLERISDALEPFSPGKGMALRGFAIIGPFEPFPKAVLKDFNDLLEMDNLGLLEIVLNKDYKNLENEILKTRDLALPLPYDASQEEAITSFSFGSSKVFILYGPPGTGKSQTIVNAIAQELHLGRNVLVICMKKHALDVIRKRLEALGIPSVYVWDPVKDKLKAYNDMLSFFPTGDEEIASVEELNEINYELKSLREGLDKIRNVLTEVREPGLSLLELYSLASKEPPPDPSLKELLLRFKYKELKKAIEELSKVKEYAKWEVEGRRPWDQREIYERDLAIGAIRIMKNFNLNLNDIEKINDINLEDLRKRPSLNISEEGLQSFERGLRVLKAVAREGDLGKIEDIYEKLKELKRKSKISLLLPKYKRMKEEVERFMNKYGIDEEDLEYALLLIELEKPLEELEDALRYWKAKHSLKRALGLNAEVIEENLEYFIALKNMFDLKKLIDLNKATIALEHFEELKYLDLVRREFDDKKRELLKYLSEYGEREIIAYFAYSWISEIEKDPEVAKAIARLRTYMEDLRKLRELMNAQGEASKRLLISETRVFDPELKESIERAKRRGIRLSAFVKRRSTLAKQFRVWLMSPEAVSELFPLVEGLFDTLIVDEASQMTPEHAVPAIYRARRLLVVGDDKQLPPGPVPGEEELPESLLDLVKGRFPSSMLKNHYRSAYEELIAFSNYAFYDGEMVIAPNPEPSKPLVYVRVNGVWKDNTNLEEAKKVVEIVKETLRKDPDKSIAIIAFNIHQKNLITKLLEEEARRDEEFKELYEKNLKLEKGGVFEGLLVQNIENVQGDERDVVIFSLVHAPDEEGKVRLHFGNLNAPGGERRLNVAITRARERVYLVTSLEPEHLGEPKAYGVKLLQEYMRYVRAVWSGNEEEVREVLSRIGRGKVIRVAKRVDEEVAKRLKDSKLNVGTSRYAVPVAFGKFALESDMAAFKSTMNSLDELIKVESLEKRGWEYRRIWSREWWKRGEEILDGIFGGLIKA